MSASDLSEAGLASRVCLVGDGAASLRRQACEARCMAWRSLTPHPLIRLCGTRGAMFCFGVEAQRQSNGLLVVVVVDRDERVWQISDNLSNSRESRPSAVMRATRLPTCSLPKRGGFQGTKGRGRAWRKRLVQIGIEGGRDVVDETAVTSSCRRSSSRPHLSSSSLRPKNTTQMVAMSAASF